jgi:predicted DNA-binding transcriptional regulator AlpA
VNLPNTGGFLSKRHTQQSTESRSPTRLLKKSEVLAIAGVTYPSVWTWMRAGTFPRSRIVGGRSMWRSDEIEAWLNGLPLRPLKGDSAIEENTAA